MRISKRQRREGWKMLVSALAAGRGISLPSLSAAGVAFAARTSGAYARIREQFNIPVGKFEGVAEPLGRIAASAYLLDAARRLTCAGLDQGHHPAVISAIMKLHATERMRSAVNDAMDIHAGKAVIDGPNNYLGTMYRGVPRTVPALVSAVEKLSCGASSTSLLLSESESTAPSARAMPKSVTRTRPQRACVVSPTPTGLSPMRTLAGFIVL